ncbi:L-rhamnose/proton symporter RhaT [Acidicapsa ligni]|uniref:L-rhamnose/proton symporter RhaT n=1 Tax=Acidicapsa ligni TaxID=542300 RepID=UPI0021E06350|nr:L-rhamnose/proton symporter RhaT [Acidicapsa ligni]
MSSSVIGILLTLFGGLLAGNCMLPLKRVRTWPWECTWLVFSLVSLVAMPYMIAGFTIPEWPHLYAALPLAAWLPSLLLGFGWGIAQVLFGLAVVRLGMSLAFTIIIGLGTVFGTLIPLITLHRAELYSRNSAILFAGCGLTIVGVALSGFAGKLRERRVVDDGAGQRSVRGADGVYLIGLGIAVLSGVLSSMLNLSLTFGEPIAQAAIHVGAEASKAAFAVWPVALAGGLIPNLGYAAWLLWKNRNWRLLTTGWGDAFLSLSMGLLWFGAVAVYGVSVRYLGRLGDSAGWAIYEITIMLTANVAGLMTGEWKRASRLSIGVLSSGVFILIIAIITIAFSTS